MWQYNDATYYSKMVNLPRDVNKKIDLAWKNSMIYSKVYFGAKPEDTDITIDFANPPVPPVGIEDVVNEGYLPAACYDMTGRQLDAPQKGINIVHMQNGKVKKMIMK